jgi:hypothetical protein
MSEPDAKAEDLGTRTFSGPFAIVWALFLFLLVGIVGVRLRNALLVCWVRGADAYLHHGIRVLKGQPLKFSDGALVPRLPAALLFFAVFVVVVFGLSFLLLFALRIYDKRSSGRRSNNA